MWLHYHGTIMDHLASLLFSLFCSFSFPYNHVHAVKKAADSYKETNQILSLVTLPLQLSAVLQDYEAVNVPSCFEFFQSTLTALIQK